MHQDTMKAPKKIELTKEQLFNLAPKYIADKWFNAERLYGLCHIAGAGCLFYASTATGYDQMYWAMLLNLLVYMPTLSLANTVSYNALEQYKCDLIKDFPPIRVWGTIGFICAMWAVDLI